MTELHRKTSHTGIIGCTGTLDFEKELSGRMVRDLK